MNTSAEQPIRVAMVMGKMLGGGVESVVMNYYRHIDRTKVQFDFLVDEDSTLVPREEIESLGGRVFEIPPYQHVLAYRRELKRLFKQEGWRIVHSHINALSIFPLSAAKSVEVPVRIAHSHATMGKGETRRNLVKLALRPFANTYPTDRVACSRYAGVWLFGKGSDFAVIPNAVELSKFKFDAGVREEMRAAWGADDDCCVVGNVGRLEGTKNQAFLIDAFSRMHVEHPDSILVIAGCGSLRDALEKKAYDMGLSTCIRFLGQVNEVDRLYHGMDVFALPSLYEGFGMALLEAQVAGLPSVVTNRVSSEVVLTDSCKLIPLEAGFDTWAQEIWKQRECGVHISVANDAFERFDIDSASNRLEDFYMRLYEGAPR